MTDSIKEILEIFDQNREYEFDYNGKFYHFEPDENGYSLWEFPAVRKISYEQKLEGKKIAAAKSGEEILGIKCFNGKTYVEIDKEITNGIFF